MNGPGIKVRQWYRTQYWCLHTQLEDFRDVMMLFYRKYQETDYMVFFTGSEFYVEFKAWGPPNDPVAIKKF